MNEFIHVHLIDKQPVGANLGRYIPLHMTVLHWFESEQQPSEIIEETGLALRALSGIAVRATVEDLFGPDNDVPVMRVDKDPKLVSLHMTLLGAMEGLGATFDRRWTGESRWNPHVTHKSDNRLHSGDIIHVTDVDLVVRSHKDGDRTILHRFALGS